MDELALDEQEHEIEPVTQPARREDRCEHGRSRGGAEEVDDELDGAINPFGGTESNAEGNGDRGRDQNGQDGALERAHEVETEPPSGHAVPQRAEGVDRGRQKDGIDDLIPHGQVPDDDEADDANDGKVRIETDRLHPLRTSRWKTSRQCALTRTKSCCDSVASLRGRAAS